MEFDTNGNHMAIIMVVSGTVKLRINDGTQSTTLIAGEMCSIDMRCTFECRATIDSRILTFFVGKPPMICDYVQLLTLFPYLEYNSSHVQILEQNDALRQFVSGLLTYVDGAVCCAHVYDLKVSEFFLILRLFYSKKDMARFMRPLVCVFDDFRVRVTELEKMCRTIGELAEHMNMSKKTFERRFKEQFGTTPKRWMMQIKGERIKKQIIDADLSVQEILTENGFTSFREFSRFFRRQFGITPEKYISSVSASGVMQRRDLVV